nr:transcription factor MYC1 [Santalum album]
MATSLRHQEEVPQNLKNQLAVVVRSIQWSYAVFWSTSSRQPGVLEWGDGYYNGDIKTRKTVQAVELNAVQMNSQRSEQLRELYESLVVGETSPQARRPTAALSPEDLTDTEWFYLVCMSFVFNIGQGLPGRALANGQPIWVCNAPFADSKVFSRSLLAKSAAIQTVVCFPFLKGVLELGVTEQVAEDPGLIQGIKTTLLENPYLSSTDDNPAFIDLDYKILNSILSPVSECEEVKTDSPNQTTDWIEPIQQREESFMVEGINGGASSQVQSWHFMDDDFAADNHNSLNSGDCVSQTFVNPEKIITATNQKRLTPLDLRSNDVHYQGVLGALLKSSHQLVLGPHFRNCNKESSFVSWRKGLVNSQKPRNGACQKLLKKVLFQVAQMHGGIFLKSCEDDGIKDEPWRPEADKNRMCCTEKINEKLIILRSLVPSINKVDRVSTLDDTIEYLKELKKKVDDLEFFRRTITSPDTIERTSDNRGNGKIGSGRRPSINKRKACECNEISEIDLILMKDGETDDLNISIIEKDVLIEIRCPWRECLLFEIMDTLSNLHLDTHSVQSSNVDGILTLTIKSKHLKGSPANVTVRMLREVLHGVVHKF